MKALLIIDVQNDYFEGGRNPLFDPEQATHKVAESLSLFRNAKLPIFHIQHINIKPNAPFFSPDTDGCKINQSVSPLPDEPVIIKHTPDSFFETDLQERLSALNVKELYVCGMMSHMCIDTSVRSAKRLGYSVYLLEDACTTKDLTWNGEVISAKTIHQTFMASLNGTFAQVVKTEELCHGELI